MRLSFCNTKTSTYTIITLYIQSISLLVLQLIFVVLFKGESANTATFGQKLAKALKWKL